MAIVDPGPPLATFSARNGHFNTCTALAPSFGSRRIKSDPAHSRALPGRCLDLRARNR